MHMGVAQHLDSLFHLIRKEAQEALVVVSDQTVVVLVRVCTFLEYAKKIQTLGLVTDYIFYDNDLGPYFPVNNRK
jgi:hypothetical protein